MIRNCQWNAGKTWAHFSFGIDFYYSKRISQILKCSLFPLSTGPEYEIEKMKYMEICQKEKHGKGGGYNKFYFMTYT